MTLNVPIMYDGFTYQENTMCNAAKYYYLSRSESDEWYVHRRGCKKMNKGSKIFIGTAYTDHQAYGTASKRPEAKFVAFCPLCIGSFPT